MHRLLSTKGRTTRTRFLVEAAAIGSGFALANLAVERTLGEDATLILLPPLFWLAATAACRRLHDLDCSGWRLMLLLIPLAGPAIVAVELFALSGSRDANRYGVDPRVRVVDYFTVR